MAYTAKSLLPPTNLDPQMTRIHPINPSRRHCDQDQRTRNENRRARRSNKNENPGHPMTKKDPAAIKAVLKTTNARNSSNEIVSPPPSVVKRRKNGPIIWKNKLDTKRRRINYSERVSHNFEMNVFTLTISCYPLIRDVLVSVSRIIS